VLAAAIALLIPLPALSANAPATTATASPAPATGAALQARLLAGLKASATGDYRAALSILNAGLAAAQSAGDLPHESLFFGAIGAVDDNAGRYADALQADERSLDIARQLGGHDVEANELNNIGLAEQHLGRYNDALQSYQQAFAVSQQLNDRSAEANELNNISIVDEELGRYADALQSYQQALALARQLNDHGVEADEINNISIVEVDLGRYGDALESNRQALALYQQLGDRGGEAKALGNIGVIQDDLGRYTDALASDQQSLELARQLGAPEIEAHALANIGVVEEQLGSYADSLQSDQQARALAVQAGDRDAEAKDLGNMGDVEADLGHFEDALTSHQQALEIARQLGNRDGEARDLGNIGNVETVLGRYGDALQSHEQALALARALGDHDLEANELNNIGVAQGDLGRYADAVASGHSAAQLDAELGSPRWKGLQTAATAEAKLDRIPGALADYQGAVGEVERLRTGLGTKSERTSFLGTASLLYNEYVAFLLDLHRRFPDKGYDRKALEIFEQQQARTFLEQIAQSAAQNFAGVPSALSNEEQTLSAQIAQVQMALAKARSPAQPQAALIASLDAEAATLATQERELDAKIQAAYPAYYALLHPAPLLAQSNDPNRLTIESFQRTIMQPGEALLIYDVLATRTALWVVTPRTFRLVLLPGGSQAVQSKLAAFEAYKQQIHHLNTPNSTLPYLGNYSQEHLGPVAAANLELYGFLIPSEIRPLIADASTLFVVPTGPLYGVPFETFVTQTTTTAGRPHYLIEDKALSYLSSATLLAVLRSGVEKQMPAPAPLLAFADPVYTVSTPPVTAAARQEVAAIGAQSRAYSAEAGFAPLPGTDEEAHAVFAALGLTPTSATLYEGEGASVATIVRLNQSGMLKSYRYVFFGAHAVLPDQVKGMTQSSLVLSHPPAGFLTMGDVFGLSLDARAVILSACDSGGGTVTSGEGVQGLTQAFMYAGTPVVSVTDWEVIDQIQPDFNKVFFSALAQGKSAAQALRQAKLTMLADDNPDDPSRSQPYFWAPTVIFGDGDAR